MLLIHRPEDEDGIIGQAVVVGHDPLPVPGDIKGGYDHLVS